MGITSSTGACPIYPRNNVFHADIRSLPTRPDSDLIIAAMGDEKLRGLSSNINEGSRGGYPINIVDSRSDPMVKFVKQGFPLPAQELGTFPMPDDPRLEGHPGLAWDQHLLLFDIATCTSNEFFIASPPNRSWYRQWEAKSVHTLDLTTNTIPRRASTVSGFSLLAGLIRYDEVAAGSIDHAISISIPNASNLPAVWPATRTDGTNTDPNAPRMGSWLRLKDIDVTGLGPRALVVVRALQKHGAIVKDSNHGGINLSGENSELWDNNDMKTLRTISASDFEVVDPTPMMVSPDSYAIR